MISVRDDLKQILGTMSFEEFMGLEGDVCKRSGDGSRETARVEVGGRSFFVKKHFGVGWGEIIKSLTSLKAPVTDSSPEVRALQELDRRGIRTTTLAAHGCEGANPATRRSFVMTDALENVESLDQVAARLLAAPKSPETMRLRYAITREAGRIAAVLHGAGLVHRDFYLCHFLVRVPEGCEFPAPDELQLFLIDLHRVRGLGLGGARWIVKDLAAFLFSSLDLPLTRRDLLRFVDAYVGEAGLKEGFLGRREFWKRVEARALAVYRRFHGREPVAPFLQ